MGNTNKADMQGGTQKKKLGRTRQQAAWPQATSREAATGGYKDFFRRWDPPLKSAFLLLETL